MSTIENRAEMARLCGFPHAELPNLVVLNEAPNKFTGFNPWRDRNDLQRVLKVIDLRGLMAKFLEQFWQSTWEKAKDYGGEDNWVWPISGNEDHNLEEGELNAWCVACVLFKTDAGELATAALEVLRGEGS